MKLAVFKDRGVGRYFAQLFDGIPETTFVLSEKNKSGLNVTPCKTIVLPERGRLQRMLRQPVRAFRRLRENGWDHKRDFHFFELEHLALSGAFDVALAGGEHSLYTLASLKAKGAKFKLVYWVPFTIPFVDMFAERSLIIREFAFPYVDLFIPITHTCEEVLRLEGISPLRISAVYPGIDLSTFYPANPPRVRSEGEFHILFAGKLTSWKGCFTLVYAAKLLAEHIPGLKVTMVGRGAQRERLEQAARLLGICDRIHFQGFVDYAEMPALYRSADAFVLPAMPAINLAEQFGFVVAEAMACGLPAVVSRVGGLPEVVGGRQELLFTPGDFRELADRLLAIYSNRALHESLGEYCLSVARARYDAVSNGRVLHHVLREMIN